MSRLTALIWLVVIVGTAFLLYSVKYEVQSVRSQIAQVSQELENEREALNVVAAEWEYLNRPERLQALSTKYLASSGTTVDQIAVVEAIPFPTSMQASAEEPQQASMAQPVRFRVETGGAR